MQGGFKISHFLSRPNTILLDKAEAQEETGPAFHCEVCGDGLESLSKLRRHTVYRHGSGSIKNRFKCSFCEVGCRTAVGLGVHMRTHTNERPYTCHVCLKSFKRTQVFIFQFVTQNFSLTNKRFLLEIITFVLDN